LPLLEKRAIQAKGPRIKALEPPSDCFPQSYPHFQWIALKLFLDQQLAAFFSIELQLLVAKP
jgi:hypothetical protein